MFKMQETFEQPMWLLKYRLHFHMKKPCFSSSHEWGIKLGRRKHLGMGQFSPANKLPFGCFYCMFGYVLLYLSSTDFFVSS